MRLWNDGRRFGSIDTAIHNACRCTFMSEQDSDYDVYRDVMDVNFFGALRLAKTVLPYMRKQKDGRMIFTSSGVGVMGFENISPYAETFPFELIEDLRREYFTD